MTLGNIRANGVRMPAANRSNEKPWPSGDGGQGYKLGSRLGTGAAWYS